MIAFEFSRVDKNVPANEFDQGDISFTIGEIKVSSAKEINRFSMIYLSITLLVDGLVGIKRRFEFIAVDSSFCIGFNKSKKNIEITHSKCKVCKVDYLVLLKALDNGVELFLADPGNDLPETSSALLDLMDSRTLLREKINSKID